MLTTSMFGVPPLDRLVRQAGADCDTDPVSRAKLRVLAALYSTAGVQAESYVVPSLRVCAVGAALLWLTIFVAIIVM